MDPFTQRMLERARARQEKIDQKLANSGQPVPKRKPLTENIEIIKSQSSPVKSPNKVVRESVVSPKKSINNSPARKSSLKSDKIDKISDIVVASPPNARNDVVVTKKEFKSPRAGSLTRRNSDVSVEINISHRNDIQIEVQVEERDAPISIIYDRSSDSGNNVMWETEDDAFNEHLEKESSNMIEPRTEKAGLRHNIKSKLDRLGNLYSDTPNLSSPIHRTELEFSSATPPRVWDQPRPVQACKGKKKFGRLAALADQINNWEDDLNQHTYNPQHKKISQRKDEKHDASTLDVSIHSIRDINTALQSNNKSSKTYVNSATFKKQTTNECQRLNKQIVAELRSRSSISVEFQLIICGKKGQLY